MAEKKEVKPKRAPRTLKEKKFVKAYMQTGNATDAVIMAGYDVKDRLVARNIGSENLAKLGMDVWFSRAGLTNETMAQNTTRIALTAKKQNQYTGEVEEDNAMQLKGMQFAAQLMGMTKTEDSTTNTFFQFIANQKNDYGTGE